MRIGGLQKVSLIDYPKHIACIVFTIGCNFRCPYCHNPELVDETAEEIPVKNVLKFLDERIGRLEGVVITGGEPTIHKDLPEFITKIKKKGYKVKLDSNGTNPEMLKELIDKKLIDYVAMDIKSPISEYSKHVGRSVNVNAIRQSIDLLMSSNIEYEFRTTVVKALLSKENIQQIGNEIKGARKYYLQKFNSNRILNPQFKRKVTYTDLEFSEFRKMLLKYVKHCEIR